MQEFSSQRWQENIRHLLDAVEKVAGYKDKKEILQTTAITMVHLLRAEAAVVSVWDSENQLIVPASFHTNGTWTLPSSWLKPKTVAQHALFNRVQSLGYCAQFNLGGMSLPLKTLKLMEEAKIESWMAFPLIGSDQSILGVIDVLDGQEPRVFGDDEVSLGALLTKLASATYQRSLLVSRSEEHERQYESIISMMSMLASPLNEKNSTPDLRDLAKIYAAAAQADRCVFSTYDPQAGRLTRMSEYQKVTGQSHYAWPKERTPADSPLVTDLFRKKKTVFYSLEDKTLPKEIVDFMQTVHAGSLLALPMVAEGRLFGLIEIIDENPAQRYSAEMLNVFHVLAKHTVRAISIAQDYARQQRERSYLEALVRAARTLNSNLNMNEVLESVLEQIVLVLNCKAANILLIEKDQARLARFIGYSTISNSIKPAMYPLSTANLKEMLETRSAVVVSDTTSTPQWVLFEGDEWIKSYVGAPMLVDDEVIGFLNMDSDVAGYFSAEILPAVEAFASIAASVIRNAQQYQIVQDRAAELEIVRRATLSLTSSLDLEEVLSSILKQSLDLFTGQCDGHIFLYQNNTLSFGAARMGDGTQGKIWSEPRENGLTYTVARTGSAIIVDDMRQHPLFRNTPGTWTGSIIGLPLKYRELVVGVMNIAHHETSRFEDHQIRVLNLLADQAAISIVNARLHNIVQEQSLTDPLTGLHNRRAFNRRLEEETLRSERYGRPFSLVLMDLNGFKAINDTFGHIEGDRVLTSIGQCLNDNVRNTDFLARYGGDEFALVMPETSKQIASQLTNRLQRVLRNGDFGLPKAPVQPITMSVGIAQFPEHATSSEKLLAAADEALYHAKRIFRRNHD